MNRETIIQMAREAGFGEMFSTVFCGELERFYALAVAKEREECAKVCDDLGGPIDPRDPDETNLAANSLAAAIRARGEAV